MNPRAERHLDWDGCCNVRDLGGLRTTYGRTTRWGAVVRADALDRLSKAGWAALEAHGIRTVIDLHVRTLLRRLGQHDHVPEIEAFLRREGTSAREIILSMLASLDVEAYLRAAGLTDADLDALRARLLEPAIRMDADDADK